MFFFYNETYLFLRGNRQTFYLLLHTLYSIEFSPYDVLPKFNRFILPSAVYGYTFISKEIRKEIIFKRFNRLLTQHKGLLR